MKKTNVCAVVEDLVTPIAQKNGCTVYDVEFKKEGSDYYLRVFIDMADQEKNVSLEECEAVSRELSDALDSADPIEQAYMLEVSSPGIDRHLRKPEHFSRYIGSEVEIGLYKAVDGSKRITAILKAFDNGVITAETESGKITLNQSETTSVRLSIKF